MIESFNGRIRDECLNANVFLPLHDAKRKIETWRTDDDEGRTQGFWINGEQERLSPSPCSDEPP